MILKYAADGLIILSFAVYLLFVFASSKKKISNSNAFDITKDMLSNYDQINIIENKNIFTVYNIKRRVVKLASRCYYSSSVSDIGVSLLEAGISGIDDYKNKAINFFRGILPNLKLLYVLPILAIVINNATYEVSDAKVSLAIIAIFCFIEYLLIGIKGSAITWIDDNIKKIKEINKDNRGRIMSFVNNVILLDKVIFISELIIIIRCVAIILN